MDTGTMTDKKYMEKNAQQTLIILDQLSQTLEVMTCVVERLKRHLVRQTSLNAEMFEDERELLQAEQEDRARTSGQLQRESFAVEISQQELEQGSDPDKVIH